MDKYSFEILSHFYTRHRLSVSDLCAIMNTDIRHVASELIWLIDNQYLKRLDAPEPGCKAVSNKTRISIEPIGRAYVEQHFAEKKRFRIMTTLQLVTAISTLGTLIFYLVTNI